MAAKTDDRLFDVRVLEHRLRRGVISQEQYQKYLDALPDDAEEGAETSTRFNEAYWLRNYGPDAEGDESDEG